MLRAHRRSVRLEPGLRDCAPPVGSNSRSSQGRKEGVGDWLVGTERRRDRGPRAALGQFGATLCTSSFSAHVRAQLAPCAPRPPFLLLLLPPRFLKARDH